MTGQMLAFFKRPERIAAEVKNREKCGHRTRLKRPCERNFRPWEVRRDWGMASRERQGKRRDTRCEKTFFLDQPGGRKGPSREEGPCVEGFSPVTSAAKKWDESLRFKGKREIKLHRLVAPRGRFWKRRRERTRAAPTTTGKSTPRCNTLLEGGKGRQLRDKGGQSNGGGLPITQYRRDQLPADHKENLRG